MRRARAGPRKRNPVGEGIEQHRCQWTCGAIPERTFAKTLATVAVHMQRVEEEFWLFELAERVAGKCDDATSLRPVRRPVRRSAGARDWLPSTDRAAPRKRSPVPGSARSGPRCARAIRSGTRRWRPCTLSEPFRAVRGNSLRARFQVDRIVTQVDRLACGDELQARQGFVPPRIVPTLPAAPRQRSAHRPDGARADARAKDSAHPRASPAAAAGCRAARARAARPR